MGDRAVLCPACGAEMELKLENFSIGADGGGGLLTLLADTYEVDLYACPQCGKVELYTAAQAAQEERESRADQVVCPVCGTTHHKDIGCPSCALRRPYVSPAAKPRDRHKPPWER